MIKTSAGLALTLPLLAGACMVEPDFERPQTTTATSYAASGDAALPTGPRLVPEDAGTPSWWTQFRAPSLDATVGQAIADNQDVAVAQARVAEAQAAVKEATGALLVQALRVLGQQEHHHRDADRAADVAHQAEQRRALVAQRTGERGESHGRQRHVDQADGHTLRDARDGDRPVVHLQRELRHLPQRQGGEAEADGDDGPRVDRRQQPADREHADQRADAARRRRQAGEHDGSLVAGLLQPVFEGGRLAAARRAAIDRYNAALASCKQTVLVAFGHVADRLQALANDNDQLRFQEEAAGTVARSLELARSSFSLGNTGIADIIDAQGRFAQAEIGLSTARAQRLVDTAGLFVALGGTPRSAGAASPSP